MISGLLNEDDYLFGEEVSFDPEDLKTRLNEFELDTLEIVKSKEGVSSHLTDFMQYDFSSQTINHASLTEEIIPIIEEQLKACKKAIEYWEEVFGPTSCIPNSYIHWRNAKTEAESLLKELQEVKKLLPAVTLYSIEHIPIAERYE